MTKIVRIETPDEKVADRIAEFAEQLGATVKRSKSAKPKTIEKNEIESSMRLEPQTIKAIIELERSKNSKNSVKEDTPSLSQLLGFKKF
jgi:hypothetical protein